MTRAYADYYAVTYKPTGGIIDGVVLLKKLLDDKDFKSELLKVVKALKNQKLRKAWEKRLK